MAKRPSFQFYPADWRNNAKLRRCSEAARGSWIDVLCLMHDSDEYGVLRWPLSDISRAAGVSLKLLKELVDREVLKGGDKGCDAYIHIPVHARKKGAPIILLEPAAGPCWYSSRFLVDEWKRSVSGGNTRFQSPDNSPSHGKVNGEVKENQSPSQSSDSTPSARQGAGATSSSSSTNLSVTNVTDGEPSKMTDPQEIIFTYGVPLLVSAGTTDKAARSFFGGLRKTHGDVAVVDKLRECIKAKPMQPLEWLAAALPPSGAKGKTPSPENFENKNYGEGIASL
ncbi:MAG TPA: hypothetical protein PKZ37_14985 [Gallionellaceae bacterium]|nr:hypothetical protein [Gallionellaceae bacterium]